MFVEAYKANGGNATQAARTAGYNGDDVTLAVVGSKLLRVAKVAEEIRRENPVNQLILTREQRQQLWTEAATTKAIDWPTRLRASELLGKSQGDFVEVHKVDLNVTLEDLVLGSMGKDKK